MRQRSLLFIELLFLGIYRLHSECLVGWSWFECRSDQRKTRSLGLQDSLKSAADYQKYCIVSAVKLDTLKSSFSMLDLPSFLKV